MQRKKKKIFPPCIFFSLNFVTNWLEDNLNSERWQQESTPFSGEIDVSKQHQQTRPAITPEGVLHWEHHYWLCCLLNQSSSPGFDKRDGCRLGWHFAAGLARSLLTMNKAGMSLFSGQTKVNVKGPKHRIKHKERFMWTSWLLHIGLNCWFGARG